MTTTKTLCIVELDLKAAKQQEGGTKLESSVGTIRLRFAGYECIVEVYLKPAKQQEGGPKLESSVGTIRLRSAGYKSSDRGRD